MPRANSPSAQEGNKPRKDPELEARRHAIEARRLERELVAQELESSRLAADRRRAEEDALEQRLALESRHREMELRLEREQWLLEEEQREREEARAAQAREEERQERAEARSYQADKERRTWLNSLLANHLRWVREQVGEWAIPEATKVIRKTCEPMEPTDPEELVREEIEGELAYHFRRELAERDVRKERSRREKFTEERAHYYARGLSEEDAAPVYDAAIDAYDHGKSEGEIEQAIRACRRRIDQEVARRRQEEQELRAAEARRLRQEEDAERQARAAEEERRRRSDHAAWERRKWNDEESRLPTLVSRKLPMGASDEDREEALEDIAECLLRHRDVGTLEEFRNEASEILADHAERLWEAQDERDWKRNMTPAVARWMTRLPVRLNSQAKEEARESLEAAYQDAAPDLAEFEARAKVVVEQFAP
jgi:hypothetical protein